MAIGPSDQLDLGSISTDLMPLTMILSVSEAHLVPTMFALLLTIPRGDSKDHLQLALSAASSSAHCSILAAHTKSLPLRPLIQSCFLSPLEASRLAATLSDDISNHVPRNQHIT